MSWIVSALTFTSPERPIQKLSDRRRYPRAKSLDLVKFSFLQDGRIDEFQVTNARDISESGLKFYSKQPLPNHRTLKLVLNLTHDAKEIPILGTTVWTNQVQGTGSQAKYHQIGVDFIEMETADRNRLRQYLSDLRTADQSVSPSSN